MVRIVTHRLINSSANQLICLVEWINFADLVPLREWNRAENEQPLEMSRSVGNPGFSHLLAVGS